MEAGIDSLAATELSSRLRSLMGVALSPTLMFEHPTARAIAAHLIEQTSYAAEAAEMSACVSYAAAATAALMMSGMVGKWPGGCDLAATRWRAQMASGDAVGGVPSTRWVLETAVDVSTLSSAQAACVRHGGFVVGAQRFDGRVFGISVRRPAQWTHSSDCCSS